MTVKVKPLPDAADRYWRESAACRNHDPDDWFPINGNAGWFAQRVCQNECPLKTREACWRWAVETGQVNGIWGGRSELELKRAVKVLETRRDENGECAQGHDLGEGNTYIGDKGVPRCLRCRRDSVMVAPLRSRCGRNHPLDADNSYFSPSGKRICRTCHRDSQVRARRRQANPADVLAPDLSARPVVRKSPPCRDCKQDRPIHTYGRCEVCAGYARRLFGEESSHANS